MIGSFAFPIFYAEELANILSIDNYKHIVKNYSNMERVSIGLRQKYNIITYRQYRGRNRPDNNIPLLTEFGAYRLALDAMSAVGMELRNAIIENVYSCRETADSTSDDGSGDDGSTNEIARKLRLLADFETYVPTTYVYVSSEDSMLDFGGKRVEVPYAKIYCEKITMRAPMSELERLDRAGSIVQIID